MIPSVITKLRASLSSSPVVEEEQITFTLCKPTASWRFHIRFESHGEAGHTVVVEPGRWGPVGVHAYDKVVSINNVVPRREPSKAEHAAQILLTSPAGDVTMVVLRPKAAGASQGAMGTWHETVDTAECEHRRQRLTAWRPEAEAIEHDHPQWICPLTFEVFRDPVVASDGHTYERAAIERWVKINTTSPVTGRTLRLDFIVDNLALRSIIEQHVAEHLPAAAGEEKVSAYLAA